MDNRVTIQDLLQQNKTTMLLRNPITGKLEVKQIGSPPQQSSAARTIENSIQRLQAVGVTPPQPQQDTSLLEKLVNLLDFTGRATRSFLEEKLNLPGLSEGVGKALENQGLLYNHPFLRGVLGFVGDIFLDPLNYITLGTATGAKALAKEGAEALVKEGAEALAKEGAEQAAKRMALKASIPFLTRTATIPIPGAISEATASKLDDISKAALKTIEPVIAPVRNLFSRGGVAYTEDEATRKAISNIQNRIMDIQREKEGWAHTVIDYIDKRLKEIGPLKYEQAKYATWLAEEELGTAGAREGAEKAKIWLASQPKKVQEKVKKLVEFHKEIADEFYKIEEPLRREGFDYRQLKGYIYRMYEDYPEKITSAYYVGKKAVRQAGNTSPFKSFMYEREIVDAYTAEKVLGLRPVYDPLKIWSARAHQSMKAQIAFGIQKQAKEALEAGTGIVKLSKLNLDEKALKNFSKWVKVEDVIPGFRSFIKASPNETILVHPDLARTIRSLNKIVTDNQEIYNLMRTVSKVTTMWKALVTTSPGYTTRNIIGDSFAMAMADIPIISQFKLLYDTMKIWSLPDDVIVTKTGITAKQFRDLVSKFNLFGHGGVEELKSLKGVLTDVSTKINLLDKGMDIVNKITLPAHALNEAVETNYKAAMFLEYLRRGHAPEQAAAVVRKYLFDYGDLTPFERALKIAFPFYTFTRKSLPVLVEGLITNPKIYKILYYASKEMRGAYDLEDEDIPDWLRMQLAVPLKINGKIRMINLGLPYSIFGEINVGKGAVETLADISRIGAGMLNPLFRVPLELASGTQLYSGMPIKSREYQMNSIRGLTNKFIPAELSYLLKQIPFPYLAGIEGPLGIIYGLSSQNQATAQVESELPPKPLPDTLTKILNSIGMSTFMPEISPERQRAINELIRRNQLVDYITMLRKDLGVNVPTMGELEKLEKSKRIQQLIKILQEQGNRSKNW